MNRQFRAILLVAALVSVLQVAGTHFMHECLHVTDVCLLPCKF